MGQYLQKYKDHYILLCEAGFIAVNQMDEDSAKKLFSAAALLAPTNSLPKIGQGYMHFCKLELSQATSIFEEVIKSEPDNELAQTLLGLCLSFSPKNQAEGEKSLESTAKAAKDPAIKNLASSALDFIEKFVKKSPSPVQSAGAKTKHKK